MFSTLREMGVACEPVDAGADLAGYEVLVVGKAAVSLDGPAPDISRVRQGLKVVMFEQTAEVLEKRFGFRIQEYGLRRVFKRVPDHPLLAGLPTEALHDWRGEAAIIPPRLDTFTIRRYSGEVLRKWCGIDMTRAYRCGNRGNVASVFVRRAGADRADGRAAPLDFLRRCSG